MVPTELTLTSLPVLVSLVTIVGAVYFLVQCVCGKKKQEEEPKLTNVQVKDPAESPPTNGYIPQNPGPVTTEAIKTEIDTGVTLLNTSRSSHNSTANHSRGNSLDLNNHQRQSGASTGSSPRPTTLSRELPDIPRSEQNHHHDDRKSHTHLPEIPTSVSRNNISSLERNSHIPTALPQVPVLQSTVLGANGKDAGSPASLRNVIGQQETNETTVNKSKGTDLDDYDHITEKKGRPRSDYDHIVIEGDKKVVVTRKSKTSEEDDDYTEVTDSRIENIYEGVPEEPGCMVIPPAIKTGGAVKKNDKSRYKDDPYNTIELNDPPYNRIKDDTPYNRIKDELDKGDVLYIDDIDPYDDLKDDVTGERSSIRKQKVTAKTPPLIDPYSFVDDERNVSNQTDPYAHVMDGEVEDPYNKVLDDENEAAKQTIRTTSPTDYTDDDYATVNKSGEVEYAKVNKRSVRDRHRNAAAASDLDTVTGNHSDTGASGNIPSSPREEIIHDEYATVVKVKKLNTSTQAPSMSGATDEGTAAVGSRVQTGQPQQFGQGQMVGAAQIGPLTPPEPPRGYQQEGSTDTDHYNTVNMVAGDSNSSDQLGPTGKKKEPPYNKLSVRESLASMNARVASNTYEYVSEVDNLYATVDGSSGDGVVTRPKSQLKAENTRAVIQSEHYSEIEGATNAPAPPSLVSLHETAKHHQEEFRKKGDYNPNDIDYYNLKDNQSQGQVVKGHSRTPSEQSQGHHGTPLGQGHFRTPSSEAMNSSFEGRVTLATEENDDLDNIKSDDNVLEFDPNYETVEEAKSKIKYEEIDGARPKDPKIRGHIYEEADSKVKYEVVKDNPEYDVKIRAHVYEEVTVTNEARRARQRVLNLHTYEEVTNIKGKGAKGQGQNGEGQSVQKRKKEHERSSSGDQSLFNWRKSGDIKDKSKDNKKKPEGKDSKKSADTGKK